MNDLARRLLAEFLGTAFLLVGVIGSGIMAERLTDDFGLQLLANAAATVGVLYAVILMFGEVSGAHLNPAVTLADILLQKRTWVDLGPYVAAQLAGGAVGVMAANLIFDLDPINISDKVRDGAGQYLGELIATFGLMVLIFSLVRTGRSRLVASAVAAYIGGAYWFTSSTSFANPAVSVTRTLSDTFAGIHPGSALMFIVMQFAGALLAVAAIRALYPDVADTGVS
ncbi:MAG TPA: aquaporin family protein [Acidimicrobiaceae bacterium]|nr:aquaporin family protein [Acidimicrobiaceae bacterium]